jgi:hypothetical protein
MSIYREQLVGTQDFLREEKPRAVTNFDDLIEVTGGMQKLKAAAKLHRFSADRVLRLEQMLASPYFGRIDFRVKERRAASDEFDKYEDKSEVTLPRAPGALLRPTPGVPSPLTLLVQPIGCT